jgi:hypothetical protein
MDILEIIQPILDLLTKNGLEGVLIGAIIGITFAIRMTDKRNAIGGRLYIVPFAVSAVLTLLWTAYAVAAAPKLPVGVRGWVTLVLKYGKDSVVYGAVAVGLNVFWRKRKAKG